VSRFLRRGGFDVRKAHPGLDRGNGGCADRLWRVTPEASGHGERAPRLPDVVDGEPSAENRTKNRRVEILHEARS
jgi:hypothetical protein